MQQTVLVAIGHELVDSFDDRLMSSACAQRFKDEVEPYITDKSLLVCEGFKDGLVGPNHKNYDYLREKLIDLPDLVRPTFAGFDVRQSDSIIDHQDMDERHRAWDRLVLSLILTDWQKRPSSLSEVVDMLKTEEHVAKVSRQPTDGERELARWVRLTSSKFDRHYLEGIKKNRLRFDRCFFIGGSIHVLAMVLRSNFPLVDLVPPVEVPTAYYGYHSTYTWPRLFKTGS